jgi:pyroglutamyl-peptidase
MEAALKSKEIPVRISNHAGAFLCNHVLYLALHEIAQSCALTECGFIHVPHLVNPDLPGGMELTRMIEAVELCLDTPLNRI